MTGSLKVGIVAHRQIEPETVQSLLALERARSPTFHFEIGCNLEWGRTKIARDLTEDFLLFVDSDMHFAPKHVELLGKALESNPKRGAVSACYVRWKDGTVVHNWGQLPAVEATERSRQLSGIHPVDQMGGGLLLISREALESVEPPPFAGSYEDGAYREGDSNFCRKLQAAGFEPSVHFGVRVSHIGPTPWTL